MDQKEILEKLEVLETRISLMIEKHITLKRELAIAIEENKSLKDLVKQQNAQLNNFQNQYKISKIVASIAPDAQNATELKEKIDEYIEEIDKCIEFLGR